MGDYFENRKQSLCNDIDDMIETADQEGYHRGYDEAWDEARDKGFDEGFDAALCMVIEKYIPESGFFQTPQTQAEYETALDAFKDNGPLSAAITINWLNNRIEGERRV